MGQPPIFWLRISPGRITVIRSYVRRTLFRCFCCVEMRNIQKRDLLQRLQDGQAASRQVGPIHLSVSLAMSLYIRLAEWFHFVVW